MLILLEVFHCSLKGDQPLSKACSFLLRPLLLLLLQLPQQPLLLLKQQRQQGLMRPIFMLLLQQLLLQPSSLLQPQPIWLPRQRRLQQPLKQQLLQLALPSIQHQLFELTQL